MDFIQSPISLGVCQVHITLPPWLQWIAEWEFLTISSFFPQALQALQRQPNAAQYFHQFMLQQQLSNAQLHSLAAVQQVRGSQLARKGGGRALQVGGEPLGPSCVLCAARLRVQSGWVLAPEVLWESHVLEVECFWNTLWKPVASRNYWVLKMWLVQVEISCKNLEFAIPPKRVKLWWAGLKTEAWKKWKWNSNTLLLHKANI